MPLKNCCICSKDNAPYKCPTCREPYCSVTCCTEHKSQLCKPPNLPEIKSEEHQNANGRKYNFPTEDTVPFEKLQQLRYSEELKETLKNPHVRDIMKAVINSPNPTDAIGLAMKEPIFMEMADVCLKIVDPLNETEF